MEAAEKIEKIEKTEKAEIKDGFGRRRHPRKELKRDIGVLYQGFYIIEKSTDVSESGLSFVSSREIPVGDKIVVTFQIPGGTIVSVRSEVRGHFKTPTGQVRTGCAYIDIRFEFKREIRNFVSARD